MYNLPWSDLLQENELPFVSYEDLSVGVVVLAPWKHRGSGIHYSKACVVEAGETVYVFVVTFGRQIVGCVLCVCVCVCVCVCERERAWVCV